MFLEGSRNDFPSSNPAVPPARNFNGFFGNAKNKIRSQDFLFKNLRSLQKIIGTPLHIHWRKDAIQLIPWQRYIASSITNTIQTPGCLPCMQTWQKKWYFKYSGRCWGHRCCSYSILCIVQIWKGATSLPKKENTAMQAALSRRYVICHHIFTCTYWNWYSQWLLWTFKKRPSKRK